MILTGIILQEEEKMLSQKAFRDGLSELCEAFDEFGSSEEKLKIWYKYSSNLDDKKWLDCIENCILRCNHTPTLADIMDLKGQNVPTKKYTKF